MSSNTSDSQPKPSILESIVDTLVGIALGPTSEQEAERHWNQYSDTDSK